MVGGLSKLCMFAIAYRNLTVDRGDVAYDRGDNSVRFGRRKQRQLQSAAAQSLLASLLERTVSGAPRQSTRNIEGKPFLVAKDGATAVEVSLSHSGSLVMAGITDLGEIGVDVEHRTAKRSIQEIATFAFGPRERRIVETSGLAGFYRIWTLREALSKARGEGFPMLADGNDYFPDAPDSGPWQTTIDGRPWLFSIDDLPNNYAAAVAIALRSDAFSVDLTQLIPHLLS